MKKSVGLPDVHSGYGFAIGNMAAFDYNDPRAIVSPGGVGFDINCGVRLLRTNLSEKDVQPMKEQLAQSMFDHIPVGVGSKGVIPMNAKFVSERKNCFFFISSALFSLYFASLIQRSRGSTRNGNGLVIT